MATAKHEREMAARRMEIDNDLRRRSQEIEATYQQRKMRLDEDMARMGMQERLVGKGLDTGAADSTVLNTLLTQSTEQSFATASDAKVESRAQAQAAGNNLATYQQAEDRDRQHQANMTGQAANMMQSAKQQPGSAVVVGPGYPQVPVQSVAPSPQPATPQPAAGGVDDLQGRLAKLKQLLDGGLITQEDYDTKKAKILDEV
jgi:hypothetical protein